MNASLWDRIDNAERTLQRLTIELDDIRRLAGAAPEPEPEFEPEPEPEPEPELEPVPLPPLIQTPFEPIRVPQVRLPEIRLRASDLFGPQAMAWAGGIVTALGIVFFFALAVNRGWIGAEARITLGAIVSVVVAAAGVWLRRRYGDTFSALGAVGAGITGAYATLAFAAVRYDFVPDAVALVVAAGIAALAIAISLAWSAEMLAGLGLVGASLTPVFLAVDSGLTTSGVAFVEIVLAAAAVVAVMRTWPGLLVASALASVPQIAVAVGFGEVDWKLVTAAAALSAILLGAGLAWQLRGGDETLSRFAAAFLLGGAVFGALAAPVLFEEPVDRGWALLAVAVVYAVVAAGFLRMQRDLSSLLAAIGLAVGAVAAASLLSDETLAMTWAAEAAVLAWLAQLVREPRYRIGALAYLGLALGHAFVVDAPASDLFRDVPHPADGTPTVMVVAAAAAVIAFLARAEWRQMAEGLWWLAAALAAYAGSLGLVAVVDSFTWGHVAVTGLWSVTALALVCTGGAIAARRLYEGGLALLVAAMAKALAFDLLELEGDARYYSLLVVGAAVLVCGFAIQRARGSETIDPLAAVSIPVSAAFLIGGVLALVDGSWSGIDLEGAALLGVAGVYAVLAGAFFRAEGLRDLSTLYWTLTLALAVPATAEILSDTFLVLAWAGAAAALAVLGTLVKEARLHAGSLAYALLAAGHAISIEAPPDRLFVAGPDPGSGVPALLLVGCAGAVLVAIRRGEGPRSHWVGGLWAVGVCATYAVSLSILELFQQFGAASVDTRFQRGHTAVTALWGLLGLALLYFGLTRRTAFRIAGLVLFGLSLAKLFLYDLSFLSSVARALSFLAVGALLLAGGFFYQRLGTVEEPEAR